MNKKKSWLILLAIIITIGILFIIIYSLNISTDMSKLIENALSKQYGIDSRIEVFDTYEIYNNEIVGFTINESKKCGFAVMKRNGNSRYKLIFVVRPERLITRATDIFYEYIALYDERYELGVEGYIVVLSMNAEFSKIKMVIDDREPIYKEIKSPPSLTVLEYPIGTSKAEILFYDKSGNLIENSYR